MDRDNRTFVKSSIGAREKVWRKDENKQYLYFMLIYYIGKCMLTSQKNWLEGQRGRIMLFRIQKMASSIVSSAFDHCSYAMWNLLIFFFHFWIIFCEYSLLVFCEHFRVLFQPRSSKLIPFQPTKVEVIESRWDLLLDTSIFSYTNIVHPMKRKSQRHMTRR